MERQHVGVRGGVGLRSRSLEFGLGLLWLGASWYLLFMLIAGMTEGWLVPWDTTPQRPAFGTWQRTLNNYFESPPGSLLPSRTFLAIGALIFAVRLASSRDRRWLPWIFAATNFALIPIGMVCIGLAWKFPELDMLRASGPVPHFGYERTWGPIGVSLLLFVALFLAQALIRIERRPAVAA